jgi:DNA polymerase III epsilon subunit-like protein
MKVLVFDTETTGLPQKTDDGKKLSIYDFDKWPNIIQISCILYDMDTNDVVIKNYYIKINNDVVISLGSFEKHNITREYLHIHGIDIVTALNEFNELVNISDVIVGHNISFDKRMVFVECLKNKITQHFTKYTNNIPIRKTEFCTMRKTTEFCNIVRHTKTTNKPYFKTPSISELYLILFPESKLPTELHNSLVDTLITLKCYVKFNYNLNVSDMNSSIKQLCSKYNCL